MSLLAHLGLRATKNMARPAAPAGAGDAAAAPPVGAVTADARPPAGDGGASAAAAKALRRDIDARGDKLRANHRIASEAMDTLEANIAKADKRRAAELEAGKKQLAERIASYERQLVQVDKDLKALDAPDTSADQFQQIMARQKAAGTIARSSEVESPEQLGRGDGRLAKLADKADQWRQNATTTTTTGFADGKSTTTVADSKARLGADGLTQDTRKTRTTTSGDTVKTAETSRKTTLGAGGFQHDQSAKRETTVDGKTSGTEVSRSTKIDGSGASVTDTTKKTAADGSEQSSTRSAGLERGDGKLGATRSNTDSSTDAKGNTRTQTSTTKGGLLAGKDGLGAYGDMEKKQETQRASGLKTGSQVGASANILCNVTAVKDSEPPLYDVSISVDLGVRVGASAGYDKKAAKGQEQATKGTGSVSGSASGKVWLKQTHRLDATQAQAYVDAVKSGNGTQREFAIIRVGLAQGWPAAQALYLGESAKATSVEAADKLKEGESIETGKQAQAGVEGELGVKGGGIGVGVKGGHERSHDESLKVTKNKDGKLEYDAKQGDGSKTSGGASLNVGVVDGSFGISRSNTTSSGVKIHIDPKHPQADRLQQELAACKSQAELDAFADRHRDTVVERSKGKAQADAAEVGVGIAGVKGGLKFGTGIAEEVVTDADGKLKEKTITGSGEGGAEVGIGKHKIGSSATESAVAKIDADGGASLDVSKQQKSTNMLDWVDARVGPGKKDGGALTAAAGGQAPADTDDHNVSGMHLKGGDLKYLGYLACNKWGDWMKACSRPAELEGWAKAGRVIAASGGKEAVVAEQLARFMGGDTHGRGAVIDSALRPKAGDMSGGARYEYPGGLAQRKARYEAIVLGECEKTLPADPAKAKEEGDKLVAELDSLYNAVKSEGSFEKKQVQAEMMAAIHARKDKVLAAVRVAAGGKADELSRKELTDKYNDLLTNCQSYKHREDEIFAKIDASFEGLFAKKDGDVQANVTLVNQLRGMYTLWDKDYELMAALAQENGFGAGIYWKYKPDRVRFDKAYKNQRPGKATEPEPETADKRRKPPQKAPPAAVADPVGEAHRELEKKRQATTQGIAGRLPQAKSKAQGAGNLLHQWIAHERKAAAVTAHVAGMEKYKSAENYAKKVKPGNVEDLESYGHIAIEDYDAAAKRFAEGLALYPRGRPPQA